MSVDERQAPTRSWTPMTSPTYTGRTDRSDEPVGVLISDATQQFGQLIRDEFKLAQAEMSEKGKRFGLGGGLLGGAGLVAFLALQALVATVIAAIAVALPVWAAGLIVTGALALVAAVLALAGRNQVKRAVPLAPEQTLDTIKADVSGIKESGQR